MGKVATGDPCVFLDGIRRRHRITVSMVSQKTYQSMDLELNVYLYKKTVDSKIKPVESKKCPQSSPVSFLAGIRRRHRITVSVVSQKTYRSMDLELNVYLYKKTVNFKIKPVESQKVATVVPCVFSSRHSEET